MLIDSTIQLERFVADARGVDAYALDTEFHLEGRYFPRVAVVQLALPGRVAVVDATAVDLRVLEPLFAGPGVAVIHAGGMDLDIVERACGARPALVFDTQVAAGFLGYSSPSLALLVSRFLGLTLDKGQQLSDWFKRPLSAEQIAYAAADVAHLLELRATLEAQLEELGRLPWAREEIDRVSRPRTPDDRTAWWRLKGSHQLKGAARARAQEIAAWREAAARESDRPLRSVLPDEMVLAIASRPPTSARDLPRSRMFDPRRLSAPTVQALVEACARGDRLPPGELRLPPERLPSHFAGLAALVSTWVDQQGRQLKIDPALLASRRDIEAFLQDEPDARLRQGWRAELIGATVERLVAGQAAVAYDGHGGLILVDARPA